MKIDNLLSLFKFNISISFRATDKAKSKELPIFKTQQSIINLMKLKTILVLKIKMLN